MLVESRDSIILDLDWHPNGDYLAVCGSDGILKIWLKKENNNFIEVFSKQRERSIRRVEWSKNGEYLVTAGFDSVAVVYSFKELPILTITEVGFLKGQDSELKTARWSPDGKNIVTCSRDKSIWIWDINEMDFIAVHNEHTQDVKDASYSPDGKVIVSVSFDGTTKVWDPIQEFGALQTFSDHKGTVWGIGFNSDNDDFVTIGEDGKAILYYNNGEIYKISNQIQLQNDLEPLYTIFYLNEKWFIAGSQKKIFILDEELTKILNIIEVNQSGDINSMKINPQNNNLLAIGNDDGTVIVLEI